MAPRCPRCGGKSQVIVEGLCVRNHEGDVFTCNTTDPRPQALYFYRLSDCRKTVTKRVGTDKDGDPIWETVTTDGHGKVIE